MIEVLRRHATSYLERTPGVAWAVRSALDKLRLCRTEALRGRTYECSGCGLRSVVHNSCGERHCPQCQGARRAAWSERHEELLLPGIDYFQVVFTLPDKLSRLVLANRRELYGLLFRAAWRSLSRELRRQNIDPAALLVLHTWNQELGHHPHLHALVPGGGPSLNRVNDPCWVTARDGTREWRERPSLTDVVALGRAFRDTFARSLGELIRRGRLRLPEEWRQLEDPRVRRDWLRSLRESDWNVFIEAPPRAGRTPRSLLRYLTRYLTGGPISDSRIVSDEDAMVTFLARVKSRRGRRARGSRPVELPGAEFVRRWSLHVLPQGFTRSRCHGGFHGQRRRAYLATCRSLLGLDAPADATATDTRLSSDVEPEAAEADGTVAEQQSPECPRCGAPLVCVEDLRRPSWRGLLGAGPITPTWRDVRSPAGSAGPSLRAQLPRPET